MTGNGFRTRPDAFAGPLRTHGFCVGGGWTTGDLVLVLGIVPVAAREWFGGHPGALWPWARTELGDRPLPEVLPVSGLDFERIVALEPDLILGVNSGLTSQEYQTLAKIALTVAQPRGNGRR